MKTNEIIKRLEAIISSHNLNVDELNGLCSDLEKNKDGFLAAPSLFKVLEVFPEENFGNPGEIVHFLESYYKKGYEEMLIASLRRRATYHTTWMLNRVINGTEGIKKQEYIALMDHIAKTTSDNDARSEAEEFMEQLR